MKFGYEILLSGSSADFLLSSDFLLPIIVAILSISLVIFYFRRILKSSQLEINSKNNEIEKLTRLVEQKNSELAIRKNQYSPVASVPDQVNEDFHPKIKTGANKLKASFLANFSHEIRTPLNSVVGFSNLLLSGDLSKETREEYIQHINYNSEKLLKIIGDIIDISRLESSQIEISYEETSVVEVINEVVAETKEAIKRNEKPIILAVKNQFEDDSDLIFSDRIWLKRVLCHLMDNAVKFTLEGTVELSFGKNIDNVLFIIKDTGIGINKENLIRIFEEFNQEIDGHQRLFEGLGVGLTLAREVVERMGGKLSVKSEKGMGSEFSFTIPYRSAGSNKYKNRVSNALDNKDWSSKKCLIVYDNKDVLIYLRKILLDTGIELESVRSGSEALSRINQKPDIDVVLLDMQMHEMNCIEVTRELKKIRKGLKVIVQTAYAYEDDKDIILEAGCDASIIKPIRKEQLLSLLSDLLEKN